MIRQRDARWWHWLNAALRYSLWNGVVPWGYRPAINEYPKSGGSWLSQMLAEAFDLPNPRRRLPVLGSSILHGHFEKLARPKDVIVI